MLHYSVCDLEFVPHIELILISSSPAMSSVALST